MIKVLSEPKAETKPKPKLKPETTPKIINKKEKLEETRKVFYELKPKLSKKEINRYRKAFYVLKTTDIVLYQK